MTMRGRWIVVLAAFAVFCYSGCSQTSKGIFAGSVTGLVSTSDGTCLSVGLRAPMFGPNGSPMCFVRSVGKLGQCVTVSTNDGPGERPGPLFPVVSISVVQHSCTTTTTATVPVAAPATTAANPTTTTSDAPTTTTVGVYRPRYDTMPELLHDMFAVFGGTLQPDDSPLGIYPLNVTTYISGSSQKIDYTGPVGIPEDVVAAAAAQGTPLVVGHDYIEIFGIDSTDHNDQCIVGGLRGLFAYDASAGTVTRIDKSRTSQIPRTQSFASFVATYNADTPPNVPPTPLNVTDPICSPSATGITGPGYK